MILQEPNIVFIVCIITPVRPLASWHKWSDSWRCAVCPNSSDDLEDDTHDRGIVNWTPQKLPNIIIDGLALEKLNDIVMNDLQIIIIIDRNGDSTGSIGMWVSDPVTEPNGITLLL